MLLSKLYRFLPLIIMLLSLINISGQHDDFELITKKIPINKQKIIIDSCSINPRTLKIYAPSNKLIDSNLYSVNSRSAEILFENIPYDTLTFKYHRFIINLNKDYFIHSLELNRKRDHQECVVR